MGRFLTRDPLKGELATPQRLNRYTYCLNNPIKLIDPWGEKDFCIDGGGEQEEPEVIGDPSYDGNGQITIPTSMGDVTIDLDTDEDWNDVDDKAKQNQVREEFGKLEEGREKYKKYHEEKNRSIRMKFSLPVCSLLGAGVNIELASSSECNKGTAAFGIGHPLAIGGGGVFALGVGIALFGLAKSLALITLIGVGIGLFGLGLIAVGLVLLLYSAHKLDEGDC